MWLAAGRPSVRKLAPSTDTVVHRGHTLTLGIVAAEFVARSPVLLPVTVVPGGDGATQRDGEGAAHRGPN